MWPSRVGATRAAVAVFAGRARTCSATGSGRLRRSQPNGDGCPPTCFGRVLRLDESTGELVDGSRRSNLDHRQRPPLRVDMPRSNLWRSCAAAVYVREGGNEPSRIAPDPGRALSRERVPWETAMCASRSWSRGSGAIAVCSSRVSWTLRRERSSWRPPRRCRTAMPCWTCRSSRSWTVAATARSRRPKGSQKRLAGRSRSAARSVSPHGCCRRSSSCGSQMLARADGAVRAVAELTPEEREVLIAARSGSTYREISVQRGVSPRHVAVLIRCALSRMCAAAVQPPPRCEPRSPPTWTGSRVELDTGAGDQRVAFTVSASMLRATTPAATSDSRALLLRA